MTVVVRVRLARRAAMKEHEAVEERPVALPSQATRAAQKAPNPAAGVGGGASEPPTTTGSDGGAKSRTVLNGRVKFVAEPNSNFIV